MMRLPAHPGCPAGDSLPSRGRGLTLVAQRYYIIGMAARPILTLVCLGVLDGELCVLGAGDARAFDLPATAVPAGGDLDAIAASLAQDVVGRPPAWCVQLRADLAEVLSVVYVTVASSAERSSRCAWLPVAGIVPGGSPAARCIAAAVALVRDRLDREPVAFRLLPPAFTLSALQRVYEVVLGRRLHKASFRRALLAAHLVEPTDEWRSEGRGRPAQLFRFAPKRRRQVPRPVRFELLG